MWYRTRTDFYENYFFLWGVCGYYFGRGRRSETGRIHRAGAYVFIDIIIVRGGLI